MLVTADLDSTLPVHYSFQDNQLASTLAHVDATKEENIYSGCDLARVKCLHAPDEPFHLEQPPLLAFTAFSIYIVK